MTDSQWLVLWSNWRNNTWTFFSVWLKDYTANFLFIVHIVLLIIVFLDIVYSLYSFYRKHRLVLDSEPLMIDLFVDKIDHRYHLFAELFLFTGLTGTAIVIQHILAQGGLGDESIRSFRTGIAFSAGGLILTMGCYLVKEFLLLFYRGRIKESHRVKIKNDQVNELQRLNDNVKTLIESQLNPTAQVQEFLNQVKELKLIFDSDKIPQYFTVEMSKVISEWERHSEEQIRTLAESVTAATSILTNIDQLTDKQISLSDRFLERLHHMQVFLSQTQQEVGGLKEDISGVRESFISEVRKIPVLMNEKGMEILTKLENSQNQILLEFKSNANIFYNSHKEYSENNNKIIEDSIRLSVKESYALLKSNIEKAMLSFGSSINKLQSEQSEKFLQYHGKIENIMTALNSNIHMEHEAYINKIEKYHNIIDVSEGAVNKRVEETSLIFQKQMHDAVAYHKKLLEMHYSNDNRMVRVLLNSANKFEALFSEEFVNEIKKNTDTMISSMSGCNETMLKFQGLFSQYYEDLEKLHSTLSQSNVLLNFLKLISRRK